MKWEILHKSFLLLLVLFISAVFVSMIRPFLMAIFLAGIFSAMAHPLFRRLVGWFGGRQAWAAAVTLLLIVLVVLLPLTGLLGIVTAQAIKVGHSVTPWVQRQISQPAAFSEMLQSIPFYEVVEPYRDTVLQKAGELVGHLSRFLINSLSSGAMGTVNFLFMLFILLYAMFFLLMDGGLLLRKILYYMPLEDDDEQRMLARFTSVTRATLKGTAVIGLIQGGLSGAAFAVVGIPSAVFWGTVMTVLSIIPGIGTGLVWAPAAVILAASGHVVKAICLAVFCAVVVGSVDNLLRPRLVGKDTEMHDLMILFATLGGIAMFGVLGVIVGPIVAALFVTIWEIYGAAFRDVLPEVGSMGEEPETAEEPSTENEGVETINQVNDESPVE